MASPAAEWPEARITAGIKEAIAALGGGDFGAQAAARTPPPPALRSIAIAPHRATPRHTAPHRPFPAVWYANPKMSLPDPNMYHVQVFWRPDKEPPSKT